MSRVTYTPIEEGNSREAARLNATLAAIDVASNTLQASNFAEEGITAAKTAFRPRELLGPVVGVVRTSVPVNASFTQFIMGDPQTMRYTGPVTLDTGDLLRCRARVHLNTVVGSTVGIGQGDQVDFRLAYDAGAGTQKVTYSERSLIRNYYADMLLHGVLFLEGWLAGPLTVNWVELQQQLSVGGSASCDRCAVWLTHFHRTNVL